MSDLPADRPERADGAAAPWWLLASVAALLCVLFHQIVAARVHFYMEQPRYSHCMLLPLVSAFWLWDRWDRIRAVPRAPSAAGLAVAGAGVLLLLYGLLQRANIVQHGALLLTLCGAVAALYGTRVVRASWFAFAYLLLTIPLPKTWDDGITGPLQGIATSAAEGAFDLFGWVVVRQGNVLSLPGLTLLMEDACSGIHSLYALVALGSAWVAFVERPLWLRLVLVASTVPVAVVANALRVTVTGVLAYRIDPKYAVGASHETTGMIVFLTGLLLFLFVDWCLRPVPPPESDAA